jgi:hypothetical protein
MIRLPRLQGTFQVMSLLGRIGKFAKSPQGKKMMQQAQQIAKDPKTKQKIEEVRGRLAHKDQHATQEHKPAAPANPPTGGDAPPPGASS